MNPFTLRGPSGGSSAAAVLSRFAEWSLGLSTLRRLYGEAQGRAAPSFCEAALAVLQVRYELPERDRGHVTPAGPLVAFANHPFGGIDGLVLLSVLSRIRPDVKLLGNYLLARIPELRDLLIQVDPFSSGSVARANGRALRQAIRWVGDGGALAMFPAGEVSHRCGPHGEITDPAWSPALARIVQITGADALPVFFSGTNGPLFNAAGAIHPRLRTALLARELLRRRGRSVPLRIGPIVRAADLKGMEPARAVSCLRTATYALRNTSSPDAAPAGPRMPAARAPVDPAERPETLANEIEALGENAILLRSGAFDVWIARAQEIPTVLREIGRLREVTFRAAGEGSGTSRDLDAFDRHYQHLFVWNRESREIVGSYRAGATDEIVARFGSAGLYTSTLFDYDPRLLSQLGPALELGRAFVRCEYQRDYSPLLLLWRGIGTYVARHPRYRMLFGTVSISNDYHSLSRQILAHFLQANSYRHDLGRLVTPRNPVSFLRTREGVSPLAGSMVKTLADVGELLRGIETDGKGVPILVRQYLKLNARVLGFNVDPAFGNVLDGLMLVDLADVEPSILSRYMTPEGARSFLAHHGVARSRVAS